jgi:hypothetical protein
MWQRQTDVTGNFASRGNLDSDVEEGSRMSSEVKIASTSQSLNFMETDQ